MTEEEQLALVDLGSDTPRVHNHAGQEQQKPMGNLEEPAPVGPTEPHALGDSPEPTGEPAKVEFVDLAEPAHEPAAYGEQVPHPAEEAAPAAEQSASDTATSGQSAAESVETTPESAPFAVEEPTLGAESGPPRLFFLTNRMNLNHLLSSRLLAPRESFHKYYADLLEMSPGWVPILVSPPSAELVERVVEERGSGAPVLLELSAAALRGERPEGPVAYVRAAALAHVRAIHFPDERSLREHHARAYSNVFPHDDLLNVTPRLFAGESGGGAVIASPSDAARTDWRQIDRVRGAISGALAAADTGEALAIAASMLGATNVPVDTLVPPWLSWPGLTTEPAEPASETAAERADRLVFRAAYRVLGERDQTQSWSPSEALGAVVDEIAAARPSDEVSAVVDRNLERVRELVNVERDFEPFRNPGTPFVAAKSLLMVLLRPDLGQLLGWSAEETGADETTRVVSALLAGRLRGVAREAVGLRSMTMDDRTAVWAVQQAYGEASELGIAEFVADGARTTLLVDGAQVKTSSPLIPDPLQAYRTLTDAARRSARTAISRRLGWPVRVLVQVPAGAEVETGESFIAITSTRSVRMDTDVDERDFTARLRSLPAHARRLANEVLDSSR